MILNEKLGFEPIQKIDEVIPNYELRITNYFVLMSRLIKNRQVKAMQEINLAEASKNLPELIEAAINGEEIVITKEISPLLN